MRTTVARRALRRIGAWLRLGNADPTRKPNVVTIRPVIEATFAASAEIEYIPAPATIRARQAVRDVAQVACNLLPAAIVRDLARRWASDIDAALRGDREGR